MKKLFFLFCVLFVIACKKEMNSELSDLGIPYFDFVLYDKGSQEFGDCTATVFGKKWETSAEVNFQDSLGHFAVFFQTFSEEGYYRDWISFGLTNGNVGSYTVTNNLYDYQFDDFSVAASYGLWASDGDLLICSYGVDTTYQNVITIESNDGETIEGTFNLLFVNRLGEHTDIPGKVFFKDGKFKVRLK